VRRLLERDPGLWLSRSWTTRHRRPGEDEDAYVFVDEPTFRARVAAGGFLEWAEFLGHLYGTPTPEAPDGSDVVLEIEVQGARQIRAASPDALLVLVTTPTPADQEARLRGRGDPDDKVAARLAVADEEIAVATSLGAVTVVNDDVDRAVAEIEGIIAARRLAGA
jgi:guanylate kinase